MTYRFGGKLSGMRAGCLGLKHCGGSEARTKFFCISANVGLGRPYQKQCSVRSIDADCMGLFFWRSETLLGNSQKKNV